MSPRRRAATATSPCRGSHIVVPYVAALTLVAAETPLSSEMSASADTGCAGAALVPRQEQRLTAGPHPLVRAGRRSSDADPGRHSPASATQLVGVDEVELVDDVLEVDDVDEVDEVVDPQK